MGMSPTSWSSIRSESGPTPRITSRADSRTASSTSSSPAGPSSRTVATPARVPVASSGEAGRLLADEPDAALQQPSRRDGIDRFGEVIALAEVRAEGSQPRDLIAALDALGYRLEPERVRKANDRADEGTFTLPPGVDSGHEGTIDLEDVD